MAPEQEFEEMTWNAEADRRLKAAQRAVWAAGDYHAFATSTVWELGPVLVDACGVVPGRRVLDVATGTGNVALRAAQAGADVVASDLTPEHFDAGRRAAAAAGVELTWVEADAEQLPFDDAEFDVVTSCLGAMFAPRQQRVADELVRVCRPGGTIGLITFAARGAAPDFFDVLAPYAPPPPPGSSSPLEWGHDPHVRRLFADRLVPLSIEERQYVERAATPYAYYDLFRTTFGPMVATLAGLADRPEQAAELERRFLDYVRRWNQGRPEGPVAIPYDYLLIVGRKRIS
jgi:ubiquinone/menaquinone biosynthesis C-methylase UbiE